MQDSFEKYVKWGFYAIMAIGALLGVYFFISDSFEILIKFSYVLVILTAASSLISPIFTFIQHPKNLKNLLFTLVIVGVIALVSFFFAGNTYTALELEQYAITASESVFISFGIVFTTIVSVLTLITVLFSSVYKFFK